MGAALTLYYQHILIVHPGEGPTEGTMKAKEAGYGEQRLVIVEQDVETATGRIGSVDLSLQCLLPSVGACGEGRQRGRIVAAAAVA